jgi:protein TonB
MHFAAASLVAAILVPLGACRTVTATPPVVAPAAESDIATEPAPEWITTSLGRTLRIAGTQNAPAVMHHVEPHYPNDALVAGKQGVVTMQVLIDKSGRVVEVTPIETLPNGLGDAAVAAVKQWTFARASVASEPVPALIDVQINFKL